jgi:hypothetical protein
MRTLDASVIFEFRSEFEAALVRGCVSGRISGARIPHVEWRGIARPCQPDVLVTVDDIGHEVEISFAGGIECPPYVVDKEGLHWDFFKVFTAMALPRIIDSGVIPFHAAAVACASGLALLPGISGAGKSSVAFAALAAGYPVLASELLFLSGGIFRAGNSQMTIDAAALDRFGMTAPPQARRDGYRVACDTADVRTAAKVSILVFPRVSQTSLSIRRISARRARMLLFENAITQLPVGQLIAHETVPLGVIPTARQLALVAVEVATLSRVSAAIIEGRPADILTYISGVESAPCH